MQKDCLSKDSANVTEQLGKQKPNLSLRYYKNINSKEIRCKKCNRVRKKHESKSRRKYVKIMYLMGTILSKCKEFSQFVFVFVVIVVAVLILAQKRDK